MNIQVRMYRAAHGGEGFIVRTDDHTILVDSGYGFCGRKMTQNLKSKLDEDEKLDMLFLTHSHYDHALGSVYIKREFPDLPIVASEHTKEIFDKKKSHELMRSLDVSAAKAFNCEPDEDLTDELSVDRVVHDGEDVFGDGECISYAFPGHTKCSMGLYFPTEKLLVSCESLGLWCDETTVSAGCISSLKSSVESIKKAQTLDCEHMVVSHFGLYDNCEKFFSDALTATESRRDEVIELLRQGKSDEEIIRAVKAGFYTESIAKSYPLQAFLTNTYAQIQMIKREFADEI